MYTACKHHKHKPKHHNRYHFSFHNFTPFCFSLYHSPTYTVNNTLFCIFSHAYAEIYTISAAYILPNFIFCTLYGNNENFKKGRNISALFSIRYLILESYAEVFDNRSALVCESHGAHVDNRCIAEETFLASAFCNSFLQLFV